MKKVLLIFLLTGCLSALHAQYPDGKQLLDRIDRNMASENRVFTSTMVINGRRATHTIKMKTWTAGALLIIDDPSWRIEPLMCYICKIF